MWKQPWEHLGTLKPTEASITLHKFPQAERRSTLKPIAAFSCLYCLAMGEHGGTHGNSKGQFCRKPNLHSDDWCKDTCTACTLNFCQAASSPCKLCSLKWGSSSVHAQRNWILNDLTAIKVVKADSWDVFGYFLKSERGSAASSEAAAIGCSACRSPRQGKARSRCNTFQLPISQCIPSKVWRSNLQNWARCICFSSLTFFQQTSPLHPAEIQAAV